MKYYNNFDNLKVGDIVEFKNEFKNNNSLGKFLVFYLYKRSKDVYVSIVNKDSNHLAGGWFLHRFI